MSYDVLHVLPLSPQVSEKPDLEIFDFWTFQSWQTCTGLIVIFIVLYLFELQLRAIPHVHYWLTTHKKGTYGVPMG